jgi:PKD-like domain/CHU_C Type IX secretion signal domain/SprB repeat
MHSGLALLPEPNVPPLPFYDNCKAAPLFCTRGERFGGNKPVAVDVRLVVGATYFLLIDGYAGDECDFSVSVAPREAVFEPPLGNVGAITGPTQLCPGSTGTFSVDPVPGASAYIWSGPPGARIDTMLLPAIVPGGQSVNITMGTAGGNICVQAANACKRNAPCAASLAVALLPPSARPNLVLDTLQSLHCDGTPATLELSVRTTGLYTYQWTIADSLARIVSGANTARPKVDREGHYAVLVTDRGNNCTSADTVRVGPPDSLRSASFALKNVTCFNAKDGTFAITAVKGGKKPYEYSVNQNAFQRDSLFNNLAGGIYPIRIRSITGCTFDTTLTIREPDELRLELGTDTTIALGRSIALWQHSQTNRTGGLRQVMVTPDSLARIACDTCLRMPLNTFRYTINLVDTNGCKVSDSRTIIVAKKREVFIPNAFSPNATERGNDRFTVFCGPDVTRIRLLRVFDQRGALVFEAENLAPNDINTGWDGSMNGRPVSPQVYVYYTEIEFKDGESSSFMGDVTVVR